MTARHPPLPAATDLTTVFFQNTDICISFKSLVMTIAEEIKAAQASARNYPELVNKLLYAGVQSYTVEVSTGITLYRLQNGSLHLHTPGTEPREVALAFDRQHTVEAIRSNQEGKIDYREFIGEIARAGVRFYEATLNGNNKRVTYIGLGGFYEESVPV